MSTIHAFQAQSGVAVAGSVALEEQNELLFNQLQVVQEELERLHRAGMERRQGITGRVVVEDGKFVEVVAENLRYRAMLEARQAISPLGGPQTLAASLGEILIRGTASISDFVATPLRLMKFWRKEKMQTPPKALGGTSFAQVIATYEKGGTAALDALLASVSISSATQANALTAVARSLMHIDPVNAAQFAHRAYALEPRPFRLKWLAFRLYEAGALTQAEAMLEALPADTKFSDSETRQANRLRYQAKQARLREVRQDPGHIERRGKAEQQIAKLEQGYREQADLAAQRRLTLDTLEAAQSRLQQEKSALLAQHAEQVETVVQLRRATEELTKTQSQLRVQLEDLLAQHAEQAELAAERGRSVEVLEAVKSKLEQENAALLTQYAEQMELAAVRGRVVQVHEAAKSLTEQEMSALREQYAKQFELACTRGQTISTLEAARLQWEQEKSALLKQSEAQRARAAGHGVAVETLHADNALLRQENSTLRVKHAEQFELAAERSRAVAQLKQRQVQLERECSEWRTQHEASFRLAEERGRALEQIKIARAQQEEEKALLHVQYVEQTRLAAERGPQIKTLQEQIQTRQTIESDLSVRQMGMQEELVKAEAQLDFIKEVFFSGVRL